MSLNAEKELKDIKTLTKDIKAALINKGRKTYGCLYGYKGNVIGYGKNSRAIREWVIEKDEADVVRIVFRLYLKDRLSPFQIASRLNEDGYKPMRAKYWAHSQITKMLKQEAYAGLCRDKQGDLIPSLIYKKPIIKRKDWDRVQVLYPAETTERFGRLPSHPASGLISCGKCGLKYNYHANGKNSYGQQSYCHDNRNKKCDCANKCVNYDSINAIFWMAFHQAMSNAPKDIYDIFLNKKEERDVLEVMKRFDLRIEEEEGKIKNFMKAISAGLDIESATKEIRKINATISEMKEKNAEMEKHLKKEKKKYHEIAEAFAVSKASEYFQASPKDKHTIMSKFLESCLLIDGIIYFTFINGYKFETNYNEMVKLLNIRKKLKKGWKIEIPEAAKKVLKHMESTESEMEKLLLSL